eukprot:6211213-Pleurochrysis_carterae.AAC.2
MKSVQRQCLARAVEHRMLLACKLRQVLPLPTCSNHSCPRDAEGHDESLIVVSMLADQVASSWGTDDERRLGVERVCEELLAGRHKRHGSRGSEGERDHV